VNIADTLGSSGQLESDFALPSFLPSVFGVSKMPPSFSARCLVVGIGSPHGDDQAGWRVIDLLHESVPEHCRLSRAKVPHELLDELGDVRLMHVVDAFAGTREKTALRRYELGCDPEGSGQLAFASADSGGADLAVDHCLRSGTTHHIDLISVMQLAQTLRTLPPRVVLWAIPGRHFHPTTELDPSCETEVRRCAERIRCELTDA